MEAAESFKGCLEIRSTCQDVQARLQVLLKHPKDSQDPAPEDHKIRQMRHCEVLTVWDDEADSGSPDIVLNPIKDAEIPSHDDWSTDDEWTSAESDSEEERD